MVDVWKEADKTVQQNTVVVECRELVGCLGLVLFFLFLAVLSEYPFPRGNTPFPRGNILVLAHLSTDIMKKCWFFSVRLG